MSKFIKLTVITRDNEDISPVLVDVEQILFVKENPESTTIRFINDATLSVKESIDEIQPLLSK